MTSFLTLGLMSGTSMDGLDIVLTAFKENEGDWSFNLLHCKTYGYDRKWVERFNQSKLLSGEELMLLDLELGKYFAECVNNFVSEFGIDKNKIDFISSHGHTVFHQPDRGFTLQIGCGESIAFHAGIPVINDFRTKNVQAGGQGAPLVPIGDKYLFSAYDACLNIGGFSNITINKNDNIIAFDISAGNLPLNLISEELGKPYDEGGKFASEGSTDQPLLQQLNDLEFYKQKPPKSLGTEWLEKFFTPLLDRQIDAKDRISTVAEHIAEQIGRILSEYQIENLLITGGGAKNQYLIEQIRSKTNANIHLPEDDIIDFKEAIIFAFLGCLYQLNIPNTLASVTGSKQDVLGGVLHLP